VIPIGLVGTCIGLVNMLVNLDNPALLWPALSKALSCVVYAAIIKLCIDMYPAETVASHDELGKHGWFAALLWLLLVVGVMAFSGSVAHYISAPAAGVLLLVVMLIVILTKAAGSADHVSQSLRFVPLAGLLTMIVSQVFILGVLHDPSLIGPAMAVGLLSLFYGNVFAVAVTLVRPDLIDEQLQMARWWYWAASLVTIVLSLVLVKVAMS